MACTITASDHINVIHEGGFSYSYASGFHYEGIKRLPVSELRQIFGLVEDRVEGLKKNELTERLKELKVRFKSSDSVQKLREILDTEQKSRREKSLARGQKMTKKELAGQLKLYGIEFKTSMTAAKLRELLIESVKEGKCDSPSEHIQELEKNLEARYKRQDQEEIEQIARKRQDEFDKCFPDPAEAATTNPKLFISRHFLALDGTPDKSKTPSVIVVPGLKQRHTWEIQESIRELFKLTKGPPSLFCFSDGPTSSEKVAALGWDKTAVTEAAKKASKPLYEKQAAEDKKRKEVRMQHHYKFVSNLPRESFPCTMKSIQGAYTVNCAEIERDWSDDVRRCDGMTLKIMPEVGSQRRNLIADFKFGVLEGLMRFRPAGIKPSCRRVALEGKSDGEKKNKLLPHESDGTYNGSLPAKKRKAPSRSELKFTASKKSRANSNPEKIDPNKFKLVFEWRGRETGEGEIDSSPFNVGWIEWDANDSSKFTGMIKIGFIGENVAFEGYKTDLISKSMKQSSDWAEYCSDPYERAYGLRWH